MSELPNLSQSSPSATVSLRTPGDLIASLPALLGFTPQRSLVAIALVPADERQRFGPMCRIDLPETSELAGALAAAILARLLPSDPAWVQLVVVDDQPAAPGAGELPQSELVQLVSGAFAVEGVACRSPLWTARVEPGGLWRCYDPCACAGTLPDPGASTAAAHHALLGQITYRDRDEAAAALAAAPDAERASLRAVLDHAHREAAAVRARNPVRAAREGVDTVRAAITATAAGQALDETELARVAVALDHPAVRDLCLGFVARRDPDVDPAAAEALWWLLTRALPAPEVAQPATLLAFARLRSGGGVMLSVALERARRADPGHQLSALLERVVDAGIAPPVVETMILGAAAETEARFHR